MKLPEKLHISSVEDLCHELNELLQSSNPVQIDVSDVTSVDTASIQSLCALQKSLEVTGNHIKWQGSSKAFHQAVDNLGLVEFLRITK